MIDVEPRIAVMSYRLVSFDKFNEFIGLEETNAIEARYK